jgi:hypothetical protein
VPAIAEADVNRRAAERVPGVAARLQKLMDCASGTYRWVMPRRGTTLLAKVSSDCVASDATLFELRFDGARFMLR